MTKTKQITLMGCMVAFLAICSFITIPGPVPFTMQTFGVCLILLLLGGKLGTITISAYMMLGLMGVPVFAGFRAGPGVIMGSTGGYILGFLFTGIIYSLFTKFLRKTLAVKVVALSLGLLVCYVFGTVWFLVVYARTTGAIGFMTALMWCVIPFIIPDALKIILAVVIYKRLRPMIGEELY